MNQIKHLNFDIIRICKIPISAINNLQDKYLRNRGTGAGGANTNNNGLKFEKNTSLKDYTTEVRQENGFPIVTFPGCSKEFISLHKGNLRKYMTQKGEKSDALEAHGTKCPDQCYGDEEGKNLFIIEDKFQKVSGSVAEKIQGVEFKIDNYKEQYPNYNIRYVYCFSDWFKKNIPAELKYLNKINIPYFWGENEGFHKRLINYICGYD